MPAGFDRCRKMGGRIRTVKPNPTTYIPICYLGKKAFKGEVHHIKDNKGAVAKAIRERK